MMDTDRICGLARKAVGVQISLLHAYGLSYAKIEEELRLTPNNGMTAWRLEGNKHKPPVAFIKQMVKSLERDQAKPETPPIVQPT